MLYQHIYRRYMLYQHIYCILKIGMQIKNKNCKFLRSLDAGISTSLFKKDFFKIFFEIFSEEQALQKRFKSPRLKKYFVGFHSSGRYSTSKTKPRGDQAAV